MVAFFALAHVHAQSGPAAARRELPAGDYTAPVTVECATLIGSEGTEVLSGAVFLPDGRFLIGGFCQDPEIMLMGVKAKVVGPDAPPFPVQNVWKKLGSQDSGKIAKPKVETVAIDDWGGKGGDEPGLPLQTDKEMAAEKKRKEDIAALMQSIPGYLKWSLLEDENVESQEVYRKVSWSDPESTAFWGVFSEDLKTVSALWRLPRGAGSISAMGISADGTVYIAGGASERIRSVSSNVQALPAVEKEGRKQPYAVPLTYVARLSADYSGLVWVRTLPMDENAPKLRALHGGDVMVSNPDIRRFSPDGELKLAKAVSRSRYPDSVAINPVTGGWCKGGDFMTSTGREPYRVPYFFIYEPDGKMFLELWRWHGAFAAVDALGHLVADAQVERIAYDDEGNLIVTARSHGGNCVHARYPWDIAKYLPGGGRFASSPCGIVKLDPNYGLVNGGSFSDPGFSSRIEHGIDGSVVLFMQSAQRHVAANALQTEVCGGRVVAILPPRLDGCRFASVIPGTDRRLLVGGSSHPEGWASATGWSRDKPKVLLLSGSYGEEKIGDKMHKTPTKNAAQTSFAGGRMDGYAVLLDLSPGPQKAEAAPVAEPFVGEKKEVRYDPPLMPAEGQRFEMGNVKYMTGHIDLREEPEGKLWPRFYDGRADPGDGFTVSLKGESRASFTLRGLYLQQADGNQDRRLFGSRLRMVSGPDGKGKTPDPPIRLEIRKMGPWVAEPWRREERTQIVLGQTPTCRVSGTLKIGAHALAVNDAVCTGNFTVPRGVTPTRPGVKPNYACFRIRLPATGREMGFGEPDVADKTIAVLFSGTGFAQVEYEELKGEVIAPPKPGAEGEKVDGDL